MASKVQIFLTDESGKIINFSSKTLTSEFPHYQGKKFKVEIQEPGQQKITVGDYTVSGGSSPPPPPPVHDCPQGQHWDEQQQKCVDDSTPPPPPPPSGNVLYNSNTDIDWASITDPSKKYTLYGTFTPNGKYIRAKASGSPRFYLNPVSKEITLEHDGKYGRLYFGVCNYQSKLECDFKLDSCSNGASFKLRNRHQFHEIEPNAPETQCQGGMGLGLRCDNVDDDLEVSHNTGEVSGPQKSFSPKLAPNEYHHVAFSQFNQNGKIHIVVEIDGKKVNEGDVNAPNQFFNEAEFMGWSEFWVRYNANAGGRLTFKNLTLTSL